MSLSPIACGRHAAAGTMCPHSSVGRNIGSNVLRTSGMLVSEVIGIARDGVTRAMQAAGETETGLCASMERVAK